MAKETTWTDTEMADAFNEWFRQYANNPNEFESRLHTLNRHIREGDAGIEPSYGRICTVFLKDLAGKTVATIAEPSAPPSLSAESAQSAVAPGL